MSVTAHHSSGIAVRTTPAAGASWHEARLRAHAAGQPVRAVLVPLAEACGSTLAQPLSALTALPPFERSAMDGFAVRGAGPWMVVARVRAGDPPARRLAAGEACEVATGAPVPAGAEAVVPYECAARRGRRLAGTAEPGRHIRRVGEECRPGEVLAEAGTTVTPQLLGLAAAAGHDALPVRRPRVHALITGDEVCGAGLPAIGRVRDAIGPMLPGLIAWAGGAPPTVTHLNDSGRALADALTGTDAELVMVSGSCSAGPADHLRTCVERLGGNLVVDGVRCRPGHPQLLARLPGDRLVVGLPGNPLAALVAFLTLAVPALAGMRGAAPADPMRVADDGLPRLPAITKLLPVRRGANGSLGVVSHHSSAMLRGVVMAEAIVVVPPAESSEPTRSHPLPGGMR